MTEKSMEEYIKEIRKTLRKKLDPVTYSKCSDSDIKAYVIKLWDADIKNAQNYFREWEKGAQAVDAAWERNR